MGNCLPNSKTSKGKAVFQPTSQKYNKAAAIDIDYETKTNSCENEIENAWEYANNLELNEVQHLLQDFNLKNSKLFVAPIKYCKCVKVYDGDTIHIVAPVFNGVISRFKVRLSFIDCPEIRTKNAFEKKAAYIARDLLSERIMHEIIELRDISYDKYGRLLATIFYKSQNINQWLIDIGWAVPYNGRGAKEVPNVDWKKKCEEYEAQVEVEKLGKSFKNIHV